MTGHGVYAWYGGGAEYAVASAGDVRNHTTWGCIVSWSCYDRVGAVNGAGEGPRSAWAYGENPWLGTLLPVAPPPACSDRLDNDGHGLVDHPADPGCFADTDTEEVDKPTWSGGRDNNNDGRSDYPADPGCTSASDNSEYNPVPVGPLLLPPPLPLLRPAGARGLARPWAAPRGNVQGKSRRAPGLRRGPERCAQAPATSLGWRGAQGAPSPPNPMGMGHMTLPEGGAC